MKNLFLFICIFPLFAFGQHMNQTEYTVLPKNEIGLNLFTLNDFSIGNIPNLRINFATRPSFIPGVYYNRSFGKNTLRSSFLYNQEIKEWNYYTDGAFYGRSTTRRALLKVGYEKDFTSKKFTPYVFCDLTFSYSSEQGIGTSSWSFRGYQNQPFSRTIYSWGISYGIGLKYQVSPKITIRAEASFDANFSYDNYLTAVSHTKTRWYQGTLCPVSKIGISYKF